MARNPRLGRSKNTTKTTVDASSNQRELKRGCSEKARPTVTLATEEDKSTAGGGGTEP
jgi:hypothetical protein